MGKNMYVAEKASEFPQPPSAYWCEETSEAFQQVCAGQQGVLPAQNNRSRGDVESWIGRNVLSVVAAVLVLLGLVLLGATVIPQLNDGAKVAVMFALSITLAVTGSALAIRHRNSFTSALMGCGMGALFVSVLATHMYFGLLNEFAAYGLVLAWMVLCMVLLYKTESMLMGVVVQLGMVASICMGYHDFVSQDRLALLLGYQLAASAIVVGGNLLLFKRASNQQTEASAETFRALYRCSLYVALALSLLVSIRQWLVFGISFFDFFFAKWDQWTSYPALVVVAACAMQLATMGALVCLLLNMELGASHAERVANADQPIAAMSNTAKQANTAPFASAALFWMASLRLNAYVAVKYLVGSAIQSTAQYASLSSASPLSTPMQAEYCATTIAVLATLACAAASMYAFIAVMRKRGESQGSPRVHAFIVPLLACGALTALPPALMALFPGGVLSFCWLWAWALVACGAAHATRSRAYFITALVMVALDAAYFAAFGFASFTQYVGQIGSAVLGAIAVAGLAVLAGWLIRALGGASKAIVAYAASLTALVLSYLWFCTPLLEEPFHWTLWCMLCSFACIAVGFKNNVSGLRLYGLVMVVACVAKLALVDTIALDPFARVCAFIVGGLICFAVSALYNFAVKRLA